MKKPSTHHLALLLVPWVLALSLTSCAEPYDHRSYVRGTGYGIDHEPVPTYTIVEDRYGRKITSGISNRDAFYFGRKYYGNRYYGRMFYGYNNEPVPYTAPDLAPY